MTTQIRAAAEAQFAALSRRTPPALSPLEQEQHATREKTARLRALRLANEADAIQDRTRRLAELRRGKLSA